MQQQCSDPQVSIKVAAKYENVPQKSTEDMMSDKREPVLKSLLNILPLQKEQPSPSLPEYFSFEKKNCIVCNFEGLKVNSHNSGRAVHKATLYKSDASVNCYFVIKECQGCRALHYPSYVEWEEQGVRKKKIHH